MVVHKCGVRNVIRLLIGEQERLRRDIYIIQSISGIFEKMILTYLVILMITMGDVG
jgi:hypothetical protein